MDLFQENKESVFPQMGSIGRLDADPVAMGLSDAFVPLDRPLALAKKTAKRAERAERAERAKRV